MPPKLLRPEIKKRYLRIAIFGKDKVGKTHLALSAPKPGIFSVEGRVESFYDRFPEMLIVPHNESRLFEDARQTLEWAMDGQYEGLETYILDSYTAIEKAFKASLNLDLDDQRNRAQNLGRRREEIEDEFLDGLKGTTACHVVFIMHEANEWAEGGDTKMRTTGKRPDATRNIEHYFDLSVHMQYDRTTRKRTATIRRSNYAHILPEGTVIENPTWAMFDAIINPKELQPTPPPPGRGTPAPTNGTKQAPAAPPQTTASGATPSAQAEPAHSVGEKLLGNAELAALYRDAGSPAGPKLTDFFAAHDIIVVDGTKISPEDRARVGKLLKALPKAANPELDTRTKIAS